MSWSSGQTEIIEGNVARQDERSNNVIRKLVCLYKRNPCLWKRDHPFYLDGERRRRAYERIHRDMTMRPDPRCNVLATFIEIMMKLREIRKSYVTELKRVVLSQSSCRRYQPTTKWFYELHEFLHPYLNYDETAELQPSINREAGETLKICNAQEKNHSKMQRVADDWLPEDTKKVRSMNFSKHRQECLDLEPTSLTSSMQRFVDPLVKYESPSGGNQKTLTDGSHRRSQTSYSTKLTYQAPRGISPMSSTSRDSSTTDFASSYTDVKSNSSAIVCNNRATYRGKKKSSSAATANVNVTAESQTRCDCAKNSIPSTDSSWESQRKDTDARIERFVRRISRQLKQVDAGAIVELQNDIQQIIDQKLAGSKNVNMNSGSQRNAVCRARTVSSTLVPCRLSIPERHDSANLIGTKSRLKENRASNDQSFENICDSRGDGKSQSVEATYRHRNRRSFSPGSCCHTPRKCCARK